MSNDLVSIITPSYNCGRFVRESLNSILAQTYTNWELLFVNDGSVDDTETIILSIKDSRIRYFKNDSKRGAAESRNLALREAKGRWIAFLDSDDIWEPTKLEKQVRFMEDNNFAYSYTNYQEIDSDSNLTGVFVTGPARVTNFGMRAFCWPGCLTIMYDANIIGQIQIRSIKRNNDYAMWLKVSEKADCFLLDECLAKYRRGRAGSVSNKGFLTMIGWHYKLWHEAEGENAIASIWNTGVNLVCGLYKKLKYVTKIR